MLTKKDIRNLVEALKGIFATKEEFNELRSGFRVLQTSVDNISYKVDKYSKEMIVLNHRLTEHDKRITRLENKDS